MLADRIKPHVKILILDSQEDHQDTTLPGSHHSEKLVHAFSPSRLNYCDALCAEPPKDYQ